MNADEVLNGGQVLVQMLGSVAMYVLLLLHSLCIGSPLR